MTAALGPRPGDLSLDDLRRVGEQTVEAIAAYHAELDHRPVMPDVTPAEVASLFVSDLPEDG